MSPLRGDVVSKRYYALREFANYSNEIPQFRFTPIGMTSTLVMTSMLIEGISCFY